MRVHRRPGGRSVDTLRKRLRARRIGRTEHWFYLHFPRCRSNGIQTDARS